MGSPSQNNGVSLGQLKPWSTWGNFNNIGFTILQLISRLQTALPVRVESCTNEGDLSPVGFVDITPLINQVDGNGNPTPHLTIYNVPYLRIQGGANAIIVDPQPGDLGIAVFASRDISKLKTTKAQANPGSFRQYDFSDALYIGGILNGVPTQYVQFSGSEIKITAVSKITLTAPEIEIKGALSQSEGDVTIDQTVFVKEDVKTGLDMISSHDHLHTSSSPGSPTSPPLP